MCVFIHVQKPGVSRDRDAGMHMQDLYGVSNIDAFGPANIAVCRVSK